MSFKFEKLIIWQKAMEMGEEINNLIDSFPRKKMYYFSSQIRRVSDSTALNISEGSILQSRKEYRRFVEYSIRSLAETVTCLHKAKSRNYLTEIKFDSIYKNCFDLMNMMIAFRRSINTKK